MIEVNVTTQGSEEAMEAILRYAGFEPHEFVTKYTKANGDEYCERCWEAVSPPAGVSDMMVTVTRVKFAS